MKPEDVYKFYGSTYQFKKSTGMSSNTLMNWLKWGNVPEEAQYKLERLTKGLLKPGDIKDKKKKELTHDEAAFRDLKAKIVKIMFEFSNKYSTQDSKLYPQTSNIIVKALNECLSEALKIQVSQEVFRE